MLGVAHLYSGVQTINGETGDQPVVAKPGQRVRVRLVNTDNGAQQAWANVPFAVAAVDGVDVNSPDDVTDREVEIPAGGRVDLLLTTPGDGSAARVEILGGPGLEIGPDGSDAPEAKQPTEKVDLLSYGSQGSLGHRHQPSSTAASRTPSAGVRASSTASRACGGASTATSTRTCR